MIVSSFQNGAVLKSMILVSFPDSSVNDPHYADSRGLPGHVSGMQWQGYSSVDKIQK